MRAILIITVPILISVVVVWLYLGNEVQYNFNPLHDVKKSEHFNEPLPESAPEKIKKGWEELRKHPYKEKRLLKLEFIESIDEHSSGLKSESIIIHNYKSRLHCRDLKSNKKVFIRIPDFKQDLVETLRDGDVFAVFGLEPKRKTLVRLEKFTGKQNSFDIETWFQGLE